MKPIYILLLVALSWASVPLQASNDVLSLGAKSAAMGRTSLLRQGAFAAFNNQAGLANLNRLAIGIAMENRFLLKDLSSLGTALVLPSKAGVFGLGIHYFGSELYGESRVNVAYGRKLSDKVNIGIALDWLTLQIVNYGSTNTVTFELGIQYTVNEQFSVAAHLYNPLQTSLTAFEVDAWPTSLKVGLGYFPNDKLTLLVEAEQNLQQPLIVKAGLEYQLRKQFYLRVGIGTKPTYTSVGLGFYVKNLKIDVASSFHPVLGYSPQLGIQYQFGSVK